MANPTYNELARRYGLEPIPESVSRLTQLVTKQDAELDEIARVIAKDPALTRRLLRAANPSARDESEYTVDSPEQALMRNGVGCALLLAMGTPLANALIKTFKTMLDWKLESIDPNDTDTLSGRQLQSTIGFSGRAAGEVRLRLSQDSAAAIAARVFGAQPGEITDPAEINDALGELVNIMTGNFKSNLSDAGLGCRLQPPVVKETDDSEEASHGSNFFVEHFTFRADNLLLLVELMVDPWSGENA